MSSIPAAAALTPELHSELVSKLRLFCTQQGIRTENNTLALTMHRNFSTDFSSVIVNLTSGRILTNYPQPDACSTYREGSIHGYLYCFNDELPVCEDEARLDVAVAAAAEPVSSAQSFCCAQVQPYKACRTMYESLFNDLKAGRGHHPDVVFEVTRQINNGAELSRTQVQLLNDAVQVATGGPFTQKMHSFKNYKCTTHDLFFAVDLFRANNVAASNVHHMRCIPRTILNFAFLKHFFASVQSSSSADASAAAAAAPSDHKLAAPELQRE
jgi:hypothetical protein